MGAEMHKKIVYIQFVICTLLFYSCVGEHWVGKTHVLVLVVRMGNLATYCIIKHIYKLEELFVSVSGLIST